MSSSFYFAGELFSQKHLIGNALLAKSIYDTSDHRYLPVLPQDLEFRDTSPKAIRDQDLLSLVQCDLALFHFDGPELDSGTVVEFMFAKFADIPSVILRTDFREGGDQAGTGDPWNLMCSFYPRTETVISSCLETSAQGGHQRQSIDHYDPAVLSANIEAHHRGIQTTAEQVIAAFDKVRAQPPILAPENAKAIYNHLQSMGGFGGNPEEIQAIFEAARQKATSAEARSL